MPTIDVKDAAGVTRTVNTLNDNLPASFAPGYGRADAGGGPIYTDEGGNLVSRSLVLTDEGTFRANFANASLAVTLGSCTITNGSVDVVCALSATTDIRPGDYIKLDADAESAWAQVDAVNSNTSITLVSAYTGTGGTSAASRSILMPFTGSGGTAPAVGSGVCTFGSGTTIAARTGVTRLLDYAPLIFRARVTLSQRITNQNIYIGLRENVAVSRWFARFDANGATNTVIVCSTGRNPTGAPTAAEQQNTTVTLPNGSTTATAHDYRIEQLTESARFYIDGALVAEHYTVIPLQSDVMAAGVECLNGGSSPSSNTTITLDYITGKNHNKVEIGVLSDREQIVAITPPDVQYSFTQAGVIAINTDLMVIDMSQARVLCLQVSALGTTGVISVLATNDLTLAGTATLMAPIGGGPKITATAAATAGFWMVQKTARYLRVRMTTATTAGTTTVFAAATSQVDTPSVEVTNATAGNLNCTAVIASGTVTTVSTLSNTTQLTPGVAAANLGKAEDAVAASGDTGVMVLGVRRDALTTSASAAADYNEMAVDRFGSTLVRSFEKTSRSFRAAANVTVAASPTDVADLFGNGTTTAIVTAIDVTGIQTTGGTPEIQVVKRSTANTAGTRVAMTAVPLDATDSAASSIPGTYTANPTLGTTIAALDRRYVIIPAAATPIGGAGVRFEFGDKGKGIVLSGTAQGIGVNLSGVTLTGGVLDVVFEWYEF